MYKLSAAIVSCMLALCATTTFAQSTEPQAQMQSINDLQLSAEQKTTLDSLQQKRIAARQKQEAMLNELQAEMNRELARESPDGARLMSYATKNADLIEEATRLRIEHLLAVKEVLSKKQFEKFLRMHWPEEEGGKRTSRRKQKAADAGY